MRATKKAASAPPPTPMGNARTGEVLRRLELDITRRLDGILHGEHRGLVPGHGSEPGEARAYQPGDDVRRIDWNVTARQNHPHIRERVADRELEAWIVADRSASLDFGTATMEKRDLVLAAAAGVGFLTAQGGNRIGAVVSTSDGLITVPARQGRKHLMAMLDRVAGAARSDRLPSHGLGEVLQHTTSVSRRRGLVAVISDFLDPTESWERQLAALGQRHQVLCIEILDPRELELPRVGVLTLVDPESGRTKEVDTNRRGLRERYAAAASHQRAEIARTVVATGADHLQLRTDRDWLLDLARHVSSTKRRRANVGRGAR